MPKIGIKCVQVEPRIHQGEGKEHEEDDIKVCTMVYIDSAVPSRVRRESDKAGEEVYVSVQMREYLPRFSNKAHNLPRFRIIGPTHEWFENTELPLLDPITGHRHFNHNN